MENHLEHLRILFPQIPQNLSNYFLRKEGKDQSEIKTKRKLRELNTSKIGSFLNTHLLHDGEGKNDIQKSMSHEGFGHSVKMETVS